MSSKCIRTGVAILILAFIALAFLAKTNAYFPFDLTITRVIQNVNFPGFDFLMTIISKLGDSLEEIISLLLLAGGLLLLKQKKESLLILFSSAGAIVLAEIVKRLVARPRPDPSLVHQVGSFLKPDSFPSGHVLFFVGFYGFLLFLVVGKMSKSWVKRSLTVVLSLLIILIGVSRIYLGAHWFSDVLGAYLLGVIWLYLMIRLFQIFQSTN